MVYLEMRDEFLNYMVLIYFLMFRVFNVIIVDDINGYFFVIIRNEDLLLVVKIFVLMVDVFFF